MEKLNDRLWDAATLAKVQAEFGKMAREAAQEATVEARRAIPPLIEEFNRSDRAEFLGEVTGIFVHAPSVLVHLGWLKKRSGGWLLPKEGQKLDLKPFTEKLKRFLQERLRLEEPCDALICLPDDYDARSADPELSDG